MTGISVYLAQSKMGRYLLILTPTFQVVRYKVHRYLHTNGLNHKKAKMELEGAFWIRFLV